MGSSTYATILVRVKVHLLIPYRERLLVSLGPTLRSVTRGSGPGESDRMGGGMGRGVPWLRVTAVVRNPKCHIPLLWGFQENRSS